MESKAPIVRFGLFELDKRTGELRKNSAKIKLEGQPIQLLELLLERPREVVTQDEIRARLWPDGTVVEFEHSIKSAVKRLRQALDDDAEAPRYVQTLPRRGYRFIAPVHAEADLGGRNGGSEVASTPAHSSLQSRWRVRAALAAAGLALVAGLAYRFRPFLPAPKVLDFTQITRDGKPKDAPLLTDGARLYFNQPELELGLPLQVSASGGDPVPVSTTFDANFAPKLIDISADHSEFLMVGSVWRSLWRGLGPLWILPTVGGGPARVGNILTHSAAWAPDGQHIAYFKDGGLYIANRGGSESRKVATFAGYPRWIQWSADGRVLRFTRIPQDLGWEDPSFVRGSLWEVRADGTYLHPLPRPYDQELECCGRWTPDGRYYVFRSGQTGGELWARCEKGTLFRRCPPEPVQLTAGPLRFLDVTPSPDGKKLYAIGSDRRVELVRYDLQSRSFEPYLSGISAEGVSFSRDGQWVAYASSPEGTLWRSKLDGSERLRITLPGMSANNPKWSPDGSQIAFQAQSPGRDQKIYVMSADGGPPRHVASEPGRDYRDQDANWFPDGKSLIFWRTGVGIERVDLSTNQVSLIPGAEHLVSDSLSPSGRYLDALTLNWEIMLFDFVTGKWTKLADGPACWRSLVTR